MATRTIEQADVKGKRVLMRVDFNVPIKGGTIRDDQRIKAALPSIRNVLDRGGRLVLMSHLGRPDGKGFESEHSLKPCAERLSELLGKQVVVPSEDCVDQASADAVKNLEDGEALLLENLRFNPAEKKGGQEFAGRLAAYGDIYCNDAFGACHRSDASMVAVPSLMSDRPRVAGLLVAKELEVFRSTMTNPASPFVAILGGAKVSDKMHVVENLIRKTDSLLIGGAMAYTFLAANGVEVGESRVERDRLNDAKRMLELAAIEKCDMYLPTDHICSSEFAERSGDIETFEENIPSGFMGLDIGPKTQGDYARVIGGAKTVVWNGPMGVFEWRPFRIGTQQVAEMVAEATSRGATSIVGGGDTATAAEQFGIAEKVSHISTGGGASLAMLAEERMEPLEMLESA